ncbi:flagellar biosynthetic protein FliR [Methylothermus subterraneus]
MPWTEAELLDAVAYFLWPLGRVAGFYLSFPLWSNHAVPVRVRVILTVVTTAAVRPALPPLPAVELLSLEAGWIVGREILIGAAIGLLVQLAFAALVFAGQTIAYQMGLGFAALIDPQLGVQVPVVAQLYLLLASLWFLGADGHLLLIELLARSFSTLPITLAGLDRGEVWTVVRWGGSVFAGGLLLSLPIVVTLLFVNLALGIATRAAPQLNIFSVGFPITLGLGLGLIGLTLPLVLERFFEDLPATYEQIRSWLKV